MVTALVQLDHRVAAKTSLPVLLPGYGKDILQGLVCRAFIPRMGQRAAGEMCLSMTLSTRTVVAADGEWWDELGARRLSAVHSILGHVFEGSLAEIAQLAVVEHAEGYAGRNDMAAAARWVQLLVSDRAKK